MAIKTVTATVNGTQYTLTNTSGNVWEATVTAPGATSFHQSGGYYNVSVRAENTAGTTAAADGATMAGLRLVVKENIKPVISITTPAAGAYVTNNMEPIEFTITDEPGGSGVNLASVTATLDGAPLALSSAAITNGYKFTYTPAAATQDGRHNLVVNARDNDGNAADQKTCEFTVDTVPPSLDVTSPAEGLITNTSDLAVTGTTNDVTSSPVTLRISLNEEDQGDISIGAGGAFSKIVTLTEGDNTITVTSTDAAGRSSAVERAVVLDTSVPRIVSASIAPNPASAQEQMVITVEVG